VLATSITVVNSWLNYLFSQHLIKGKNADSKYAPDIESAATIHNTNNMEAKTHFTDSWIANTNNLDVNNDNMSTR
jgi:hypothetical protein